MHEFTLVRKEIYCGTSGLVTPVPKALYPPAFRDRSRLEYYSSLFNSIEINSSFYKLPMAATVKKWMTLVPDDFRFTFKLSKSVTHINALEFDPAEIDLFMQVVSFTGNKKGCILIQLPPGCHGMYLRKLAEILQQLRQTDSQQEWDLAVEFRHNSWYHEQVYRILNEYNATMVLHDIPLSATPAEEHESDIVYLRFHGPGGRYRGSYEDDFLHEYANYIKGWAAAGKKVYCYFNNTMGDAMKNLQYLLSGL